MIKQIGLPLRGRPILLITHMIIDRIGLHSVLLPLLITVYLGCLDLVFGKDEKLKLMKLYLIKFQQTFKFRLSPGGE